MTLRNIFYAYDNRNVFILQRVLFFYYVLKAVSQGDGCHFCQVELPLTLRQRNSYRGARFQQKLYLAWINVPLYLPHRDTFILGFFFSTFLNNKLDQKEKNTTRESETIVSQFDITIKIVVTDY